MHKLKYLFNPNDERIWHVILRPRCFSESIRSIYESKYIYNHSLEMILIYEPNF